MYAAIYIVYKEPGPELSWFSYAFVFERIAAYWAFSVHYTVLQIIHFIFIPSTVIRMKLSQSTIKHRAVSKIETVISRPPLTSSCSGVVSSYRSFYCTAALGQKGINQRFRPSCWSSCRYRNTPAAGGLGRGSGLTAVIKAATPLKLPPGSSGLSSGTDGWHRETRGCRCVSRGWYQRPVALIETTASQSRVNLIPEFRPTYSDAVMIFIKFAKYRHYLRVTNAANTCQ